MENAVKAVSNKEMGLLKASKFYSVPRSTLKDYVKNNGKNTIDARIGRKPILPLELEKDLERYCLEMEDKYYGLTRNDIKRMAYCLAIRNNLQHPFSKQKESAGRKWLNLFLKRHPNLSVRKPQPVSDARIKGFTPENVSKFFSILEPELVKINFNPNKIFNVDETGITVVQHKTTKIIGMKGKRKISSLSSAERGALVTAVMCMSAAGQFVPPMLVFPRKNMKAELLDDGPPGTIAACHPSGWIQAEIFTKWLAHFISVVKPSVSEPVLLVLDGHYSHTRNLEVIDMARESGVGIICLPPHSTHMMQPLDVSFMSPFKTYYSQEIENWLKSNIGRVVTHYQVASLMRKAYVRAATVEVAVNGFRKTGIFPFNPNLFRENDFLENPVNDDNLNGPSGTTEFVRPSDVSPIPDIQKPSTSGTSNNATPSRKSSACLITGSPHKRKLLDAINNKNSISAKRALSIQSAQPKNKRRPHKGRKRTESSSSEEVSDSETSSDDEDTDANCIYCTKSFSEDKKGEKWVRCTKCFYWCHENCAGDGSDNPKFICTECLDG